LLGLHVGLERRSFKPIEQLAVLDFRSLLEKPLSQERGDART
jgi:hypothetical protein